jgi:hypothetical protein
MPVAQMRKLISKKYGPSWAKKVERMSDPQVAAVYLRMLDKGLLK